jgi:DNA polymerase-3 subunit delta'
VQFKDIIGQHEIKKKLTQLYQQNRLSHALLFLGKEGNGSLSLARAFTQYIVCEKVNGKSSSLENGPSLFGEEQPIQQDTENDSCGICTACQKASKLVHPDIHYSYPAVTKKSGDKLLSSDYAVEWRSFLANQPYGNTYDWLQFINAENKQGNISAHECNDINRKLSLKSFESEYKFLIMWMPEYLQNEGNKLLKLVEEPPPNTIFIFVAENESLILPTILSRTQLIKIPLLQNNDIEEALQSKEKTDPVVAHQISSMSEGNYREALQQLQHADDNWEVLLRDWLNTIIKTGPAAQVKWIEEVSKLGREKQKQFLKYFMHLLEYAIRIRTLGAVNPNETNDYSEGQQTSIDFSSRFNKLCDISQQEAIIKELDTATYHIERNANAKILFHALTIRLYHIISNKSVILVS